MVDYDLVKSKADSDFLFLKALIKFAKANDWRVVVSGGYGMDFFLNKLTRYHGDLDVIIYGKENRSDAVRKLEKFIQGYFSKAKILTKPQEFYVEIDINVLGFGANLYFVETVDDPNINLKKIRKFNGDVIVNKISEFPMPVSGKIGDFEVEVQDQNAHLADIFKRRGHDKSLSKHDPDILRLTKVTDPKKVEFLLKQK
jgi:hypothetical protein